MSHGAKAATAQRVSQFRSAKAGRRLWVRALNGVGGWLPGLPEPSAERWWDVARSKEPGCVEPTPEAVRALATLVESINESAALNTLGRLSARDDTVRMARTHLRIERCLRDAPEILEHEIPPLLFIVGWPRTGSTALHTLMAEDPRVRTIPYWESFDPVPPESGPDQRVEKVERMLAQLDGIAPDYHAIHPMAAEMTEECVALFMNHFRTLQYDFQYRIPRYVSWLLSEDARIAYEAYHQSLRLVHWFRPAGERFVVKDPTHLVHLEMILKLWPDAKIVFTHRDPLESISSLCSLYAHTRAIFSDDVDPYAIGREIMEGHWPRALDRGLALRERLPPGRLADVRHVDLLRDPIGTVERVYADLGWVFTDDARSAMQHFLAQEAAKPSSTHEHSLEGFGIEAEAVHERFRLYRENFDLGAARQPPARAR